MGETDLVADTPEKFGEAAAAQAVAVPASAAPPYHVKGEVIEADDAPSPPAPADKPFDPAAWMHQRLVNQIVEFEKNLGPDHEIGGRFVEGPGSEPLHISNVASWGPDMILFMGQFADGRRFELIQHYSQVSVLLVAMPKITEEPRRIGFELMKSYKELPQPWGDPIS